MLGMAKNRGFTMLSPSNASQMMLKNISSDDKIISSKFDFLIHLTIIYTSYHNETWVFSYFQRAYQLLSDLKIWKFSCQYVSFPYVNPLSR